MKALKVGFLITAVCTTFFAASAFAGAGQVVKADIPFSFYAGDQMFPAGNYVLTVDDPNAPTLLTIENRTGERHEFVLTESEDGQKAAGVIDKSELVFNRYGKDHFLAEVQVSGFDEARELPMSHLERQRLEASREHVSLQKAG